MRLTLARKLEAVKRETVTKRKAMPRVCLARPIQADHLGIKLDFFAGNNEFCRLPPRDLLGNMSKFEAEISLPCTDGLNVVIIDWLREL